MFAILIAVRDASIALALAWIGVSVESRVSAENCGGEACRGAQDH